MTDHEHYLVVCAFFSVIHGDVIVVDDVQVVIALYPMGGFSRVVPNALSEKYEYIFIRRVPCWS